MRILLTGGTGFIGTVLGPRLVAAGHDLFCICRPGASTAFGQDVPWDGTGPIDFSKLPASMDAVIHLAQSRRFRAFPADSREMFGVNVAMTMSLLEWAAQSKVKQFCLASSGAVYEPFDGPLREDAVSFPMGFLGASKLASELIARPFSKVFALSILRLFFPYGPGQQNRLIPDLIHRVRNGVAVQLPANGEGSRLTPTFVEDVAEVILRSVDEGWTETINVATSETLSIRGIANAIGRQLGIEPKFEIGSAGSAVDMVPDLTRLAGRFDLDRFTRFDAGLNRTIAHALNKTTIAS